MLVTVEIPHPACLVALTDRNFLRESDTGIVGRSCSMSILVQHYAARTLDTELLEQPQSAAAVVEVSRVSGLESSSQDST
jgi:hypothetical protein